MSSDNSTRRVRKLNFSWQKVLNIWAVKPKCVVIDNTQLWNISALGRNAGRIQLSTGLNTLFYLCPNKKSKFNTYAITKVLNFKFWGYSLRTSNLVTTLRLVCAIAEPRVPHYNKPRCFFESSTLSKIITLL